MFRSQLSFAGAALAVSLFATGCTANSSDPIASSTDDLSAVPCRVEIVDSSLGVIYANQAKLSLYTFDNDTTTESTCYGPCAERWPALLVGSAYGIPAPFGVTTRTDGKKQLTLDGHPLYRFFNDAAPGDVNGQGLGGVWHLARPAAAHVVTSSAGEIYANGLEHSLYTFDNDTTTESTCNGPCAERWPALIVPSAKGIEAPFGVTTRTDGKTQVTLDGHPLYTFFNDLAPGDVNGDGIGGVWHLARPSAPAPAQPY
jgi:predicted lipoprotein with Yx(FWY)xxD motif